MNSKQRKIQDHPSFPNFLRIDGKEPTVSVGRLFKTDKEAAAYWDEIKAAWVKHVRTRRRQIAESERDKRERAAFQPSGDSHG